AIEPRHHEELLEELRALRERVELSRRQTRRNEEVAGAARRVADQERRLQLEKAPLVQDAPGGGVHPRADEERPLRGGAAQVEVAVGEPLLLGGVGAVLDEEGRRLAAVEDLRLDGVDLDLAGHELGIRVRASRDHLPPHSEAVLEAQLVGELAELLADVLLEHHLGEARAIAQVDEHRAAVIAAVVDPSEEDHFASHVPRDELAARVRASELADEFRHVASLCSGLRPPRLATPAGSSVPSHLRPCRGRFGNTSTENRELDFTSTESSAVGFPVAQVSSCHGSLLSFRPDYLCAP